MAITLEKKNSFNSYLLIALVVTLVTAVFFYWNSMHAMKLQDFAVQRAKAAENEKGQLSQELTQFKTQMEEQHQKVDQMSKELIEAKNSKQLLDQELKQKTDELMKVQGRYEKRISELEQDIKRYADFQSILNKALEPIREAIQSSSHLTSPSMAGIASAVPVSSDQTQASAANADKSADLTSGQIVSVNRDYGFIVTNLGSSRGIKSGSILQIYRLNQPLGIAQVEKVKDNLSAASVVSEDLISCLEDSDPVVLAS